jgi:hypothetical protein
MAFVEIIQETAGPMCSEKKCPARDLVKKIKKLQGTEIGGEEVIEQAMGETCPRVWEELESVSMPRTPPTGMQEVQWQEVGRVVKRARREGIFTDELAGTVFKRR